MEATTRQSTAFDTPDLETNNAVHIAFVVDENNVLQLAAAATAAVRYMRRDRKVHFHILYTAAISEKIAKLKRILERSPLVHVSPVSLQYDTLKDFPMVGFIPPISYARLLLPQLVDVSRLIYLDCDLLIRADVSDLWEQELNGMPVAAVIDESIQRLDARNCLAYCRDEIIDPSQRAFNAGVLLIDLNAWRSTVVPRRAINFVEKFRDKLYSADQDVLNFLFDNNWLRLPPKWNLPQGFLKGSRRPKSELAEFEIYRHTNVNEGAIYHFNGPLKPWNSGISHPGRREWYHDVKASNWFGPVEWLMWRSREELRALAYNLRSRLRGNSSPTPFKSSAAALAATPGLSNQ